ncbi:Ribosome biogenesis protein brx1 [Tulasnella sp. 408]|nr:Ribosome biogenesis protein brx1 [Tulasnella sp. 408]
MATVFKAQQKNADRAAKQDGKGKKRALEFEDEDSDEAMEDVKPKKQSRLNGKGKEEVQPVKRNKQRVLMLSSRGVTSRMRHLMKDLECLLPHTKKDSKLDVKSQLYLLPELADLNNCNNCLFFEARRHEDLYLWAVKTPNGPSIRMHVQNIHTMDELKMTGNCLKGSRGLLSFDAAFDQDEHWRLTKELFTHIFGVPPGARRSKPFIDHILSFSILDGKIWFRNFQIMEKDPLQPEGPPTMSLIEIGPRFVLTPIKIFEGAFNGAVVYRNEEFIAPAKLRRAGPHTKLDRYRKKMFAAKERDQRKTARALPEDEFSVPKSETDLHLISNFPPIWVPTRQIQSDLQPLPIFFQDPIGGTLIYARRFRAQAVLLDGAKSPTLDPNRCRGVWFRPNPEVYNVLKSIEQDMLDALGRICRGAKKADDAAVVGYLLQVFEHFLWTLAEGASASALYKTFYDPIHLIEVTECHMRNAMENKRRGRSYEFGAWTLGGQIGPYSQDDEDKHRISYSGRDCRKRKDRVESDSDMSISENGAGDFDIDDMGTEHGDPKSDRTNKNKRRKLDKAPESSPQVFSAVGVQASSGLPEKGTRAWKKWNATKLLTTRGMQLVSSQQGSSQASRDTTRFSIRRKTASPDSSLSSTVIEQQVSRDSPRVPKIQSIKGETNVDGMEALGPAPGGPKVSEAAVSVLYGNNPERVEGTAYSRSRAINDEVSASSQGNAEKLQEGPEEDSWEVYLMGEGGRVQRLLGSSDVLKGVHQLVLAQASGRSMEGQQLDEDTIRSFDQTLSNILCDFIVDAYDYAEFGPPPLPTLPTAAVVGGSSNRRSFIFERAFTMYRESKPLFVSELHARDCANLTNTMKSLILGFVGQVAADDEDEDDVNGVGGSRSGGPALANYDINLLEAWYRPFAKRQNPPKLVVVVSDFEAFDTSVLEDMLYICSRHSKTLPLVFIFNLSTSTSYIHQSLSLKTLGCLELSSFAAEGGQELFRNVISAVFFNLEFDAGVMFSHEALEVLTRTYETYGSFDAVQSLIQLLLLRHFSHPLSVLTTECPPAASITPEFRALLRSKLASGTDRFLALQLSEGEQSEMRDKVVKDVLAAKDDAGLVRAVNSLREAFVKNVEARKVALDVALILRYAEGGDSRQNVLDVFRSAQDVERYLEVLGGRIRRKSSTELVDYLHRLLDRFDHLGEDGLPQEVANLRGQLDSILGKFEKEIDGEEERGSPSKSQPFGVNVKRASDNAFADQVLDCLAIFMRDRLYPFECNPLYEAWYVSAEGADSIKELLNPSIRSSMISALLAPHAYLQCTCCKPTTASEPEAGAVSMASYPDMSIAFSRYLNSGKLVNIYDWYETFAVGLEGEKELAAKGQTNGKAAKGGGKKKGGKVEDEEEEDEEEATKKLEARFLRCFHEFDHLGLLRHSGRKVDHVMRTVYEIPD